MKTAGGTKRVLLRDIASATGFTVNTVSRALQNKPDISKNTCAHVQQVASEMGYVRNTLASSLRSGRSRTVAVIVGGVSNPFYAIMIDTLHDLAEEIGYTVLVLCTRDSAQQERNAILTAISRQADGVLLFPGNEPEENIALMRRSGIPFVLVGRRPDNPDYDYVVSDEETGGYLAGNHLLQAGHRKLGFVYSYHVIFSLRQRIDGLMRAVREAGLPETNVSLCQNQNDRQMETQLRLWKAQGITGLFVFCDIEAWQLLSLLEAHGMGSDFSLVGFDNIQNTIHFPSPLCTVDGSMRELAKAAFQILMDRFQGDDSPPRSLVYPVHLVCRGSCHRIP
jgi:LacI family transcriptional regulator